MTMAVIPKMKPHKPGYEAIECPKCGVDTLYKEDTGQIHFHLPYNPPPYRDVGFCKASDMVLCEDCGGTGCKDTPHSGSEPGCETCSGEGFLT